MSGLSVIDGLGFGAAGLVLATFCMCSMSALRWVAIASNVAFIAYGYLGGLAPVLMLHALLLPVNICRLAQLRSAYGRSDSTEGRAGMTLNGSFFRPSEMSRQAVLPRGGYHGPSSAPALASGCTPSTSAPAGFLRRTAPYDHKNV